MIKIEEKTISELENEEAILAIQDGNHGEKHPKTTDYVDEGIPFVMANDLNGGRVNLESCNKLKKDQADKLRVGFARSGDVLLTHKGTIGNVAILGDVNPYVMLTPQVTYYRVNEKKLSKEYLAYAFRDTFFQKRMKSQAQQSTRPYIGIKAQRRLSIRWRDRTEQDLIVRILKPYDDLIENNRRRIALLERAARELYREWFVRLRFPGHEHTRIVDGVPEGWKKVTFAELADFVNGYAFKPADLGDEGLPIIKIPELKNGITEKTPRNPGDLIPKKYHVKDGDLLFSWSGTLAVNMWSSGDALLNQHLFLVVPKGRVSRAFLMFALREALVSFNNQTVGATMKHIRRSALDAVTLSLPDDALSRDVEDILFNIWRQVMNLRMQNSQLAAARDLLLPRLMDGRIEV